MVIPAFFKSRNFVSSFQHPWVYNLNVILILQAHVRKVGFCISNADISRAAENSKPRKSFENARQQALEFALQNRKVGAPSLKNGFPTKKIWIFPKKWVKYTLFSWHIFRFLANWRFVRNFCWNRNFDLDRNYEWTFN